MLCSEIKIAVKSNTKRNTMTKQASDIFLYEDFEYDLLDYDGKDLINPRDFDMEPEFVETDCYKGFISNYEITIFGYF